MQMPLAPELRSLSSARSPSSASADGQALGEKEVSDPFCRDRPLGCFAQKGSDTSFPLVAKSICAAAGTTNATMLPAYRNNQASAEPLKVDGLGRPVTNTPETSPPFDLESNDGSGYSCGPIIFHRSAHRIARQ